MLITAALALDIASCVAVGISNASLLSKITLIALIIVKCAAFLFLKFAEPRRISTILSRVILYGVATAIFVFGCISGEWIIAGTIAWSLLFDFFFDVVTTL